MTDGGTDHARHIQAPARVLGLALTAGGQEVCGLLAGFRHARWSAADGRLVHEVTYRGPEVAAVAITTAGDRLAVASTDGAVRILEATTLATTGEMHRSPTPRGALAFSADGSLLAGFARGRHLELTVWSVKTGAPVCTFADPLQEPAGIAFHPSGRSAAVAMLTGDVRLLDLASGRPGRTLSEARMACEALSFSPDGRGLLAASYDGVLQLWSTESWNVRRLPGVPGAKAVAVSPDGARAAVSRSSYNPPDTPAEARLVDLRTGTVIRSAAPGIASTTDVAFTGPRTARVAAARGTEIVLQDLE